MAVLLSLTLCSTVIVNTGCGKSDLSKLHDGLSKTAKALNAAVKTNGTLYDGAVYGPVGSPQAIAMRQKVARVIHDSNEHLIRALNLAQNLTAETFEQGKLAVLQALSQAGANLTVGNQTIDLVLQGVATLINQAVVLIQAFQSKHLKYVLPEIKTWRLPEVAV